MMILQSITAQMRFTPLLEFHKCLTLRSMSSLRLIQLLFPASKLTQGAAEVKVCVFTSQFSILPRQDSQSFSLKTSDQSRALPSFSALPISSVARKRSNRCPETGGTSVITMDSPLPANPFNFLQNRSERESANSSE